jgi:hypothetical protein
VRRILLLVLLTVSASLVASAPDAPPQVEHFAPTQTAKQPRQAVARFSVPMVAFGDLRADAPFTVECPAPGVGHWIDARNWVYDFENALPSGLRCTFALREGLEALDGRAVGGTRRFSFDTGGPGILSTAPWEGSAAVDENQVFVLALDGPVDERSVVTRSHCQVSGLREKIPVELVVGDEHKALLDALRASERDRELLRSLGVREPRSADAAALSDAQSRMIALKCRRRLPPETEISLVWGKGLAGPTGLRTAADQRIRFTTRPAFTARMSCDRVNRGRACLPMLPINVHFSGQIAAETAVGVTLVDASGRAFAAEPLSPQLEPWVSSVTFPGPFPAGARLRLELPPAIKDDSGRALENARQFPLEVHVDEYPPLVKFPGEFGILEAAEGGVLPVTVRNVEPSLVARRLPAEGVPGRQRRVMEDAEIIQWMERVREGMAAKQEWIDKPDGSSEPKELTGAEPVLADTLEATPFRVPVSAGGKAFEVVGIPLRDPGFYVVELASPRLGAALLGENRPRYVATAALVTNMAVHLKRGREDSLVWVTRLDDGSPLADAAIAVRRSPSGDLLWEGRTGTDGTARIPGTTLALKEVSGAVFISARHGGDLSFVLSDWDDGIQPWDFNLTTYGGDGPLMLHSVLDRSLLRAGETVSMKHYARQRSTAGIGLPSAMPTRMRIVHVGSDDSRESPVSFDAAGIAESSWEIPADARLGAYRIEMRDGDRWRESGSFRVEQFRLPTMRGLIQPPAEPLVNAREARLDLYVGYLNGGGAGGLPVKLRTLVRPREVSYPDHSDFRFAAEPVREGIERSDGRDWGEDGEGAPGLAQVIPLALDAEGAARVTVPDLRPGQGAQELVAELEYPDASGERLTVPSRLALWPALLSLGIKTEGWAAERDRARFEVVALDLSGKPISGQQVSVAVYQRATYSHRRRLLGGFYDYEHRTETRRIDAACSGATDSRGRLACDIRPGVSGQLVLQARSVDAQGNRAEATGDVWLAGPDEQWFGGGPSDRMDVLPERTEYEAGERARLQVRMPFRRATALVTVEREGVMEAFVAPLERTSPVVEVPVVPTHAPNVYVSVLAVRGRIGGPDGPPAGPEESTQVSALVDLGRPAFRLGIAQLKVGWAPHRLEVRVVPDGEVYPVRGQAKVKVSVKRASGGDTLPAPAEVAFAAVDEALLELRPNSTWKLLEAMLGEVRPIEVSTATAQMQVVGKRHYGRKAVPTGGGGGRQGARQLFDTLLLWRGRVALDANGEAELQVPLNDSLTAFRLAAVASAGVDLFGLGEGRIRTHQDAMLLSGLLPTVREGDRYLATFTVRSGADRPLKLDAQAQVAPAQGPGLPALAPQALELAPGEARTLTWEVVAPRDAGTLTWNVSVDEVSGAARDALQVTQRVIPAVPERVYQAVVTQLEGPFALEVQRPPEALPDRGGVRVALQARLAEGLEGVTSYMKDYPYSCLEQRVSKVIAAGKRAGWETLVDTLPQHQDRDGLFKYFATDWLRGSDALTAYVLAVAHEAGWILPPAVLQRAISGLKGFVEAKSPRRDAFRAPDLVVRKLAAIEVLARYGRATPQMLQTLYVDPASWPTSAVLDWIGILRRVEKVPDAAARLHQAEAILRSRLDLQGRALRFSSEQGDRLWWLMVSGDVNAARALLTILAAPGWEADVPRLAAGALGRLKNGRWDTTVANAWGSLAMRAFSARFDSQPVDGTTQVALGDAARALAWSEAARPTVDLPWRGEGRAPLRLEHHGGGRPWVSIESRAAIPLTAPVMAGLTVKRTVEPVEQQMPGTWTRGDVARVRLEMEARSDLTWVVVDDPVPAGATVLGGRLGRDSQLLTQGERQSGAAWPVFEERRFDAYRAYYETVPSGPWSLEYTVRFDNPGRFELPPTRLEVLYAPEVFAELPNAAVEVGAAP